MISQRSTFLACLLAAMAVVATYAQGRHCVTGSVFDDKYVALPDVAITLERGSERPIATHSQGDGTYEICFAEGAPITVITYEQPQRHPSHVGTISGRRAHEVHAILRSRSSQMTYVQGLHVLSSYEYLYRMVERWFPQRTGALKEQYLSAIEGIPGGPFEQMENKEQQQKLNLRLREEAKAVVMIYQGLR